MFCCDVCTLSQTVHGFASAQGNPTSAWSEISKQAGPFISNSLDAFLIIDKNANYRKMPETSVRHRQTLCNFYCHGTASKTVQILSKHLMKKSKLSRGTQIRSGVACTKQTATNRALPAGCRPSNAEQSYAHFKRWVARFIASHDEAHQSVG